MRTRGIRAVLLPFLLVAALVLSACSSDEGASDNGDISTPSDDGGGDDGGTSSSSADGGDTPDEPVQGGTFDMVTGNEPTTLNPLTGVRSDQIVSIAMVERLVGTDANFAPSNNALASDWERVDDTTWQFTLREGVTFHNGEPMNADAVVFSLDEHKNNATGVLGTFFQVIDTVTAVNDTTVEVTTTIPTSALPALLTNLYVFPPEYYAEVGAEAFGQEPIGTGPFQFEEWVPGERITATAFSDYWRGTPNLDGIQWSWAADAATRAALVETGEADVVVNMPVSQWNQIEQAEGVGLEVVPTQSKLTIFLNKEVPPLDDPVLREAFVRAIDRDAIVDAVFEGEGARASDTYFHSFFESAGGHPDDVKVGYSPDEAAALLDQAGDVPPITWSYTTDRYASDTEVGEAVAGMLEAVGFTVERNPLDTGTFFGAAIGGELDGAYMFGTVPVYPHEDVLVRAFLTSDSITKTCIDERFDTLADEALAAEGEQADELYNEIERIALYDLYCFVPLYEQNIGFGIDESVQDFSPAPDDLHDYFPLWLMPES